MSKAGASLQPLAEVRDRLIRVLRVHLRFLAPEEGLSLDTPLADLGLDSMSAIDLLFDLEEAFEIAFPNELMVPETFETARSLENVVEALLRG